MLQLSWELARTIRFRIATKLTLLLHQFTFKTSKTSELTDFYFHIDTFLSNLSSCRHLVFFLSEITQKLVFWVSGTLISPYRRKGFHLIHNYWTSNKGGKVSLKALPWATGPWDIPSCRNSSGARSGPRARSFVCKLPCKNIRREHKVVKRML